jgi:hypothetical protein
MERPLLDTVIDTERVRIITDAWSDDEVWLELECCSANIHAIITPDETKRVIAGLQKVLTWMEENSGKAQPCSQGLD